MGSPCGLHCKPKEKAPPCGSATFDMIRLLYYKLAVPAIPSVAVMVPVAGLAVLRPLPAIDV